MVGSWKPRILGAVAGLALLHATAPAGAADGKPVALVDSISISVPGVAPMDYLRAETTIDLGAAGVLVVDYLASCIREEITGGLVRIGTTQSAVERGKVSRRRVECDGAELQLTAAQSDQGGVAVYRSAMNRGPDGLPLPDLTIRSRAPFVATRASSVRAERLDASEPLLEIPAAAGARAGVDFGQTGTLLSAGGLYRITAGKRSMVVRIEAEAGGAEVPRLSRLVPL